MINHTRVIFDPLRFMPHQQICFFTTGFRHVYLEICHKSQAFWEARVGLVMVQEVSAAPMIICGLVDAWVPTKRVQTTTGWLQLRASFTSNKPECLILFREIFIQYKVISLDLPLNVMGKLLKFWTRVYIHASRKNIFWRQYLKYFRNKLKAFQLSKNLIQKYNYCTITM